MQNAMLGHVVRCLKMPERSHFAMVRATERIPKVVVGQGLFFVARGLQWIPGVVERTGSSARFSPGMGGQPQQQRHGVVCLD